MWTFLSHTLSIHPFKKPQWKKLCRQELWPLLNILLPSEMQKETINGVYVIGTETIQGKNSVVVFFVFCCFVFVNNSFPTRKEILRWLKRFLMAFMAHVSSAASHSVELFSEIPFSLIFQGFLEILFLGMIERLRNNVSREYRKGI